ncbi:hypothetical protein LV84_04095 [Algoriphagus ratkowskyi]|uniref:Apea-like HEPN domain-containing protein n=2 Tax=Algoriphagus ratkowskyi TaxID=57028 RepID=A0A2W7QVD2_9BACT|nr:hypothetical protein LV84_04095 [Algoriphagus ratkowskyi]
MDRIDSILSEFNFLRDIKRLKIDPFKIAKYRHYYSHFYEEDFQYLYKTDDLIDVTFDLRKLLYCWLQFHSFLPFWSNLFRVAFPISCILNPRLPRGLFKG